MDEIVIVSAARTPVGTFNGAFAAVPAHVLGQVAVKAAIERAKLEPGEVDEVILGQILTAGEGQNPARQAARAAGVKMGELGLVDTMLKDGLWDAFHGYHMGVTAENVAKAYQITREQQDAFALASQQKASAAQ